MIRNARFAEAGSAPGLAAGWTLRSVCQAEAIAPFGPPPAAPVEAFDRWSALMGAFGDGTLALAVFGGGVARERFDWPVPTLWAELSGGVVAGSFRDAFVWAAAPFTTVWTEVASMGAAFAGSARETFEAGWRVDALLVLLADEALARAAFQALSVETFEAGWTANPTLR